MKSVLFSTLALTVLGAEKQMDCEAMWKGDSLSLAADKGFPPRPLVEGNSQADGFAL